MAKDGRPEHLRKSGQQALQGAIQFEEVHNRIVLATSELLDSYESDQITASMIQTKAGVTRVTFTRHFNSALEAIREAQPRN